MASGVKVNKNESAMASLQKRLPHWIHHTRVDESNVNAHWIHHTRVDESNVNGMVYLPKCDCSECGYTVSFEKPVCPHCHVKMNVFKKK